MKFRHTGEYVPPKPGPVILLPTNKKIGIHQGMYSHTIGQKFRVGGLESKVYVCKKDKSKNTIYVVSGG